MATTPLEFTAPTGLTLTVDLVDPADDSLVIDDGSATEETNAKGQYRVDHTGAETGVHLMVLASGGSVIGRQWINIEADDTTVYRAVDSYLEAARTLLTGKSYTHTNDNTAAAAPVTITPT